MPMQFRPSFAVYVRRRSDRVQGAGVDPAMKRCEEKAIRGTGTGTCDRPLDDQGRCPNWRKHVVEADKEFLDRLDQQALRDRNGA